MLGYSGTLDKSMNGVKTLTDGISIISDGIAQHENIIYNDYVKSQDGQTEIINDTVTTINVNAQNITGENITGDDLNTNILNCNYLYVNDLSNPLQDVMEVDGNLNKLKMNGTTEFRNTVNVINANLLQTQTGYIQQTGTLFNTLKDTKINGFLEVGSNITQTGGSTILKDLTVDNITQNTNKGITQSGTSVSNILSGTTTVKNLTIIDSVTFPSNITIPGTTTNDDIVMIDDSIITQDITTSTTKFNLLRNTKTLNLDIDGNLTQTKAGATATLKNTIIQGTTSLQGDITQTAGSTILNTIQCDNITLRANNNINFSGTGKIIQTGTGINSMNAITLNNNQNITFNGTGIISQALNGVNIFTHFRSAGFSIIMGRNNTTFSHYQNIQNINGFHTQHNRDNSSFHSYLINNRVTAGGAFRFQRYNGGVYLDEPMIIDDNITINKDVSIVGKSISASSATLGIISQTEIDCLDNCNVNILTKFNTLDSQISSLQTTTGGVSTATTGITYNSTSDTTTIDNDLTVSSGKSLLLGTTNVNSFITSTNTFITAATNTLQGIVYTTIDDTTAINNNVNVTGNLIVQGMNIKAEIDALDSSFTTGTLNTTTLTAGTLNVSNQMNMTNPTRSSRNINNVGFLKFCDYAAATDINSFTIAQDGIHTYYSNLRNGGGHHFFGVNANGTNSSNRLIVLPDASTSSFNPTTQLNDVVVTSVGTTGNPRSLNLICNSSTANGVRIQPTRTTVTGGNSNIIVDTSGIIFNGTQKINNDLRFYSGLNYTELKETNETFIVNNKSETNPKINFNILDENLVELSNMQMNVKTSFIIDNTAEFIPNFLNEATISSKNLGTTNIYAGIISVSSFKKQINISLPISVYRKYKNVVANAGFSNIIQDTLNSVAYTINKNGIFFSSGNCTASDTLPKTIGIASTSSLTSREYEVYMTNVAFSFIPSFDSMNDLYTIYITPTYSVNVPIQADNLIVESFGYFINTNITGTTYPLSVGTTGINYASSNYNLTDYGSNYLTGLGSAKLNNVFTNNIDNQYTITSQNVNTSKFFCSGKTFKAMAGIAGYFVSGTIAYELSPIFCSLKEIKPNDFDTYIIILPGYRIVTYADKLYGGTSKNYDNTNATQQNLYLSDNTATSIKVYFMNEEIIMAPLS